MVQVVQLQHIQSGGFVSQLKSRAEHKQVAVWIAHALPMSTHRARWMRPTGVVRLDPSHLAGCAASSPPHRRRDLWLGVDTGLQVQQDWRERRRGDHGSPEPRTCPLSTAPPLGYGIAIVFRNAKASCIAHPETLTPTLTNPNANAGLQDSDYCIASFPHVEGPGVEPLLRSGPYLSEADT